MICIVVGAGPQDVLPRLKLARAGIRVLVLEKHTLPRCKACAGAVSGRAIKWLDVDFMPVVEDVIRKVKSQVGKRKSRPGEEYDLGYPYCLFGDAPRFDHLLAQEAAAAGADLHEGEKLGPD